MIEPPIMLPIVTGNRLPEKIAPGEPRKIRCRLANGSPEGLWSAGFDEQTHWNEIDIRDAMFEAGSGKGSDRRDSRNNPVDVRARAETHPNRQTNQGVAQDARALKPG